MIEKLSVFKQALKEVYSAKGYFFLSGSITLLLFLFNVTINNYQLLLSEFSFRLFFSLVRGSLQSIATTSLVLLTVLSLLAGIVVSFTIFLLKRQISSGVPLSASSLLVSLLAPACPSCAIGLLSVLGLGGFLAFLPFKGLELGVLGILALLFFLASLSKKITTTVCSLKK